MEKEDSYSYKDLCEEIANEIKKKDILIVNRVTGLIVRTSEDVWNFDSHGGLSHIIEWYEMLFPGRIEFNLESFTFRIKR